jgi:hypothetical protein
MDLTKVVPAIQGQLENGINMFKEQLSNNTETTVVVVVVLVAALVYAFLKELFDVLTGANKSALKQRIDILEEDINSKDAIISNVADRNEELRRANEELLSQNNELELELFNLKAINWDKVFPPEIISHIQVDANVFEDTVDAKEQKEAGGSLHEGGSI